VDTPRHLHALPRPDDGPRALLTWGWTVHVTLKVLHMNRPDAAYRLSETIVDSLTARVTEVTVERDILTATLTQPARGPYGNPHDAIGQAVDASTPRRHHACGRRGRHRRRCRGRFPMRLTVTP
jgi:hypothetical protein